MPRIHRLLVPVLTLAAVLPAQRPPDGAATLQKLLQQYDKDKNGKIDKNEYPRGADAFANLDRDRNGAIDGADFAPGVARAGRGDGKGRPAEDPKKLPKVGDVAPDFDLPMLGVKDKTVKLSSFAGDRPVALIFGSYT
ncbi:MAG: hypothetical protein JNK15_00560 [Planctomycetes bacterium]|nr:hypothetical protein [Planctomycetota bacterium]